MAKRKKAKKKVARKKTAQKKTATKKKKTAKKPSDTCFVLMPFKEPFDMYYDSIIAPAIIKANLLPQRGDSLFRPTPIMGDIWKMIQGAKVMLAELTGKNANVFYELGLGHSIGKPIVLISETMEDVPFDLRPLRVITYDKDKPNWGDILKSKIIATLEEILSEPIEAVPPMFRKKVKSQAPEESEISSRVSMLELKLNRLEIDQGYQTRTMMGTPIKVLPPIQQLMDTIQQFFSFRGRKAVVAQYEKGTIRVKVADPMPNVLLDKFHATFIHDLRKVSCRVVFYNKNNDEIAFVTLA